MTETHDHSSLPSTILNFLSRLREEPERDDGQSLASPERWPPALTRCPSSPSWLSAGQQFRVYTKNCRSPRHLTSLAFGASRQMPVYCDEHHEAELERLSARRGRMETEQTRTGSRGRSHRLQISGSLTPCRRRPGSWTGRVSYTQNRSDWTKILLEFINRSDSDSEAVRKLIAGQTQTRGLVE